MAVARGVGLQHVRGAGMVPPGFARQRSAEAGLLQWIAAQPLAQERERPGGAAEAQGAQLAGPLARVAARQGQLRRQVFAEIDAAAVVLQALQALHGPLLPLRRTGQQRFGPQQL